MHSVIFIPTWADLVAAERACLELAGEHGVHPDTMTREWPEVARLVHTGQLDLLFVASRDHLPPERTPRIVAADDNLTPPPAERRRPEILRRPTMGAPQRPRPSGQ